MAIRARVHVPALVGSLAEVGVRTVDGKEVDGDGLSEAPAWRNLIS